MNDIDARAIRRMRRSFLTGVTVVTAQGSDGSPVGMTANSFASVSIDPPLVQFSIMKTSSNRDAFVEAGAFNIHILSAEQELLARNFASRPNGERFDGVEYDRSPSGAPRIAGVGTWVECTTWKIVDAGDHLILIGEVTGCEAADARPLGFFQSQFHSFHVEDELVQRVAEQAGLVSVGWVLETEDGGILMRRGPDGRLALPHAAVRSEALTDPEISRLASAAIGASAAVDLLYSLYESAAGPLTLIYRGSARRPPAGEAASGVVVLAEEQVPEADFADPIERNVVRRFISERAEAQFGIYTGSRSDGVVAAVSGVIRDVPQTARHTEMEHTSA